MLQLDFDLGQVIDFIFGSLKFLGSLLVNLALILLLFVQFIDQLVLVGDLVVQVADLVVLGRLVLL